MAERRSLRGRLSETARGVAGTLSSGTKQAVGAVKERVTGDDEVDQLQARVDRIREEARREAEQEARQEFQEEYRKSVQESIEEQRKEELRRRYGTQDQQQSQSSSRSDSERVGAGFLSMPAPGVPDPGTGGTARVNTGQVPSPISRDEEKRREREAFVAIGGPPADDNGDREDPHVPLNFEL